MSENDRNERNLKYITPTSVLMRLLIISCKTSSSILAWSICKTSEDWMLHPRIWSSREHSHNKSWSHRRRSCEGVPIWIFPFNIQLTIWRPISTSILPKPNIIITHRRRIGISTVTVEGLIKGTILHLGNGPDGVIQSILSTSMGTGNPRIEVSRRQVAVVSGKTHSKSGKGDDEIVGIWWRTPCLLRFLLTIPSLTNHDEYSSPSPLIPIAPLPSPMKSTPSPNIFVSHLSDDFHIDTFMIMLVYSWPPAFLLLSFILIFWHNLSYSKDYLSAARQVLPLSTSHLVMTICPSFNTCYLGLFQSARHVFDDLFLDIT